MEDAAALYDLAPCGHLSYDRDGLLLGVNQTFLDWTGYRREDLVGARRFVDLLTPAGRIYHETHCAPLLRMQHSVSEIAMTVVAADRGRLPVLLSSRLVLSEDGEERLTLASVFKATDRRRYEQELMHARRRAEEATSRFELMQRVAAELAAAGDLAAVSEVLVRAGTDSLGADACVLWLRHPPDRAVGSAAARGLRGDHTAAMDLPLADPALTDEALRRGEVLVAPGEVACRRFARACSALGVGPGAALALAPLCEQGRLSGVLACRFDGREALDGSQLDLLRTLAYQAALAVPRARLFEQQRDVAQALQRTLLPGELPRDPRVRLAFVYRPARDGPTVGGDWYDAFWLDDGRLAVVVGDVVGRGVNAAAAMGQLRSALRAVASVSPDPAAVLEALDHFVEGVPAASSATVVYGVLDVASGRLRYACAGHPPPVLVSPAGGAALLWGGRSVPLGVRLGNEHRTAADAVLPVGARLLLYTDGLVERRDSSLDARIDGLVSEVEARAGEPVEAMVENLADTMLQGLQVPDDVCLLCLSLPPDPGGQPGRA